MRSGAEESSANSKRSDQLFMRYLISYKNQLRYMVFIADQIMHEQLIRLLRVGKGLLGF